MQLKTEGHRCVENVSRSNCAVCLEDIHHSRIPCHIPTCGHLLHRTCFEQLLVSGYYACPTCQQSMLDMKQLWNYLDNEVLVTPMPKEYENFFVDILCKDCHEVSQEVAQFFTFLSSMYFLGIVGQVSRGRLKMSELRVWRLQHHSNPKAHSKRQANAEHLAQWRQQRRLRVELIKQQRQRRLTLERLAHRSSHQHSRI